MTKQKQPRSKSPIVLIRMPTPMPNATPTDAEIGPIAKKDSIFGLLIARVLNIIKILYVGITLSFGVALFLMLATYVVSFSGASIAVGSIYIGEVEELCPVEKNIPLLLIIGGCFGVFFWATAVLIFMACLKDRKAFKTAFTITWGIICLGSWVWLLTSSIYIYKVHPVVDFKNASSPYHCDEKLYKFAFWDLASQWILLGMASFIGLVLFAHAKLLVHSA